MKHTFTQNDLVSYIYKEKSFSESLAIESAINSDWNLRDSCQELVEGFNQLPKVRFRPSLSRIKTILKYSANSLVDASC